MVEGHRVVPDRVPHTVGHPPDVPSPVVHQDQVEVAPWRQVTSTEAAHGQQYQSPGRQGHIAHVPAWPAEPTTPRLFCPGHRHQALR